MKRGILRRTAALALSLALAGSMATPMTIDTQAAKKKVTYVDRAAMITNLWKLAGKPSSTGTLSFTDVKKSASYYKALRWAVRTGIVKNGKTFKPTSKVTRQQLTVYYWKYAGSPTPDSSQRAASALPDGQRKRSSLRG